jgi:drug/metabolite transporter (DMT)-like permease
MPILALIIVLIAALLHAISNLFFKSGRNSSAFLWWAITVGAVWYGVVVAVQSSLAMPLEAWRIIIPSIIVEVAYARLITLGYENGDLSQVYPIARGTPPLLIAIFGALFIGERLPLLGYVGIVVLVIGIYLASVPSFNDVFKPLRALTHRPTQIAFLAALCVTTYTLLDKVGMQYASPLVYNWWMYTGIAIGYAPIAWSRGHRDATLIEWRTNWRRIILGSFATIGSYLAALIGLQMTAASYVGSVRASSVVIGALLGWLLLKEQFGAVRVFAAALMVAGLLLIALA